MGTQIFKAFWSTIIVYLVIEHKIRAFKNDISAENVSYCFGIVI